VLHEVPFKKHTPDGSTQIPYAPQLPAQHPLASVHVSSTGPGVAGFPSAAAHSAMQYVPSHRPRQQS
jgi:hypothetical protein